MNGMILIAACLVCLDRLFFRGQLVSHIADGFRKVFSRKPKPSGSHRLLSPAKTEVPSLIVFKQYVSGHTRTDTVEIGNKEQSVKEGAIFAPATAQASAMESWDSLVVQPPIGENGEPEEVQEPPEAPVATPSAVLPVELRDPEIHALLDGLEAGERIQTDDATAEELQAIANFDMRAYV